MTHSEKTANTFLADLKALPKDERDAVIVRIAQDEQLGEDILDLATIAARRKEASRPFKAYVSERRGE